MSSASVTLTRGPSSREERAPLKKEDEDVYTRFNAAMLRVVVGFGVVPVMGVAVAKAQYGHASIAGWGHQVFGADLSADFVALGAEGV